MSAQPIRSMARPAKAADVGLQFSDSANAKNLAEHAGDTIRWVADMKKWLNRSADNLYAIDEDGGTTRHAQQAARRWIGLAMQQTDLDSLKKMTAHATRSLNRSKINDAIELAKAEPGISITAAALDADPWLLSARNGVIDLRTGELRARRPGDLMTKCAAAPYKPDAGCPQFKTFLLEVTNDRPEIVDFLQMLFGYALYGGNPEQVMALFVGTGANGKSTLLAVILEILADYAKTTPAETFVHRPEGAASNDLARLMGARLVSATEAEANRRLAENLVKRLTGGDRIAARFLFAEYFEFVPAFLAFLAVNHRPTVSGDDPAIWRRLLIVPFDRVIPPEQRDPRLAEKLLTERDGILAWMVRGCLKWQQAGRLVVPDICVAAATEYRESMDSFGTWIGDQCVVMTGVSAPAGQLYEDFAQWCNDNGHQAMSSTKFGAKLVDRGFVKHKTKTANVYRGIGLRAK